MTRTFAVVAGLTICGLSTIAALAAHQRVPTPPAADRVPVLVELFTSEGCSSCPPADKLLIELLEKQPVPGALVVGLSEHVDYWNNLGWKDPFSDAFFSQRQSSYASAGGDGQVYTPQMIVDGKRAFVGSDRNEALAAIAEAAKRPKSALTLTLLQRPAPAVAIDVNGGTALAGADIMLAIIEDGLSSAVRAGENSGQTLPHAAVTRRLTRIGRTDAGGHFTNPQLPLDLDHQWRREALHLIAFASRTGKGVGALVSIKVNF